VAAAGFWRRRTVPAYETDAASFHRACRRLARKSPKSIGFILVPDAAGRPEVRYPAFGGDAGAGERHHYLRLLHPAARNRRHRFQDRAAIIAQVSGGAGVDASIPKRAIVVEDGIAENQRGHPTSLRAAPCGLNPSEDRFCDAVAVSAPALRLLEP